MQKDTFPNACEYARASVWGLKISKARTLALVPSRAPLAPPRPVRPLALGSPALPPCSFTTVGSCSLTGDAPGTLTRVEGARRVAASGTRVRRQSFRRARATVARESIACVHTTASRRARGNRAMHPCTHAPMHACVRAYKRRRRQYTRITVALFARASGVQSSSLGRARVSSTTRGRPPHPAHARRARAHTHIHITRTHRPAHSATAPSHRETHTQNTRRIASHRIASHRIAIDAAYPFSPFSAPPRPHRRRPATTHSTQAYSCDSHLAARVASTIAARARASRARHRRLFRAR